MQAGTVTSFSSAPYETDPARLPGLLHQLVADLADPAVAYLLGGHYYDRTNHSRYRHFPAVFALQQQAVTNVEVGPDFIAFDTELRRHPERGESGYPGSRADRFRATVPLAQLYQLCRKVLTPAEQTSEEISYEPETVVYYNATVHGNHPTPADSNQAYAAVLTPGEHPLVAVFTALQAGLADPENHYLVNTTSFDSPAGPVLLGMLHLNAHTVQNLVIEADACTASVLLDPHDRRQRSAVRVSFDHVWQVLHGDSPSLDAGEAEAEAGLLYYAPDVLRAYARQEQPA